MKRVLMLGVLAVAGSAVFAVYIANAVVEMLSGTVELPREREFYGR